MKDLQEPSNIPRIPRPPESAKAKFLATCMVLAVVYIGFSFAFHAFADPPTSPYLPGETLSPTCSPTSTNCTVEPPLFSTTTLPQGGVLFVNDGSGTITANTSSLYWNTVAAMLQVGSAPTQATTDTVLQLGTNLISGGNASGTWFGINAASSSNADLLNLQENSTSVLRVSSSGAVTFNENAGTQFDIYATAVPTADLFHIANSATTTATIAGLNNLESDYWGGTGAIEAANVRLSVTAGPTSGSIWDGLRIVENTTTQAGVTENGIKIDPITNSTGTENAIFIGNGWQTGLLVAGNPSGLASSSLIQLASTSIEGGNNTSGTFIGINPVSFGGDFLNFQVNSTTQFKVSATGTILANGTLSLGVASATEGKLTLFSGLTNFGATLQANTSTASNLTFTLPSTAGSAGQSLITDGAGNLSWGSTGFTISAATTTVKALTTTTSTYISTGLHPSSVNSQVWITGDIVASTTAQSSTITVAAYSGASACTTQVGNAVSVELSLASGTITTTGIAQQTEVAINVIASPATTSLASYTLCARASGSNATALSGTITLQEIRGGSDIAEAYNTATDTPLEPGDVVSLDPTIDAGVMQSQVPYDTSLLGVVSTQPGAVLGNNNPDSGGSVLVALAGRVPVNVTDDNGDINIGDELTSADIPGYAMRSTEPGRVVGVAMENFAPDPSTGITTGTILMFVNPGWSLGSLTSTADIASSSWALESVVSGSATGTAAIVLDQFTAYVQAALAKLGVVIVNGIATLQGIVADTVNTNELCVQGVCVNGTQLANLLNNGTTSSTGLAAPPPPSSPPSLTSASSTSDASSSVSDDGGGDGTDATSSTDMTASSTVSSASSTDADIDTSSSTVSSTDASSTGS
jgi:hypothetical protein